MYNRYKSNKFDHLYGLNWTNIVETRVAYIVSFFGVNDKNNSAQDSYQL